MMRRRQASARDEAIALGLLSREFHVRLISVAAAIDRLSSLPMAECLRILRTVTCDDTCSIARGLRSLEQALAVLEELPDLLGEENTNDPESEADEEEEMEDQCEADEEEEEERPTGRRRRRRS
jgi:hypothetical protein